MNRNNFHEIRHRARNNPWVNEISICIGYSRPKRIILTFIRLRKLVDGRLVILSHFRWTTSLRGSLLPFFLLKHGAQKFGLIHFNILLGILNRLQITIVVRAPAIDDEMVKRRWLKASTSASSIFRWTRPTSSLKSAESTAPTLLLRAFLKSIENEEQAESFSVESFATGLFASVLGL